MFESVVKFDLGVKPFGSDVKPALGQVDRTFFVVYTKEEKVDCCKEKPMTAFMRVRAETQTDCTGVAVTLAVCMGVAEMPSICTGMVDIPPDCNEIGGTPPLKQKKRKGLMTRSVTRPSRSYFLILQDLFILFLKKRPLRS